MFSFTSIFYFSLIAFPLCIYYEQIIDFILLRYAYYKKNKIRNEYEILGVNLYQKNKLIKTYKYLLPFSSLKKKIPALDYIEVKYLFLGNEYRIIFDKDFDFPPYENDLKLPEGYKFKFLTCTDNKNDYTERINQLLGPKHNFYKDIGLKFPVSYITDEVLECLDNNLNSINLSEFLEIK